MAKKTGKSKGQKRTPSTRRSGSGRGAAARSGAGSGRTAQARRNTGRRTAGAKTPKGKAARKKSTNPPRPGKRAKSATGRRRAAAGQTAKRRGATIRRGGSGREETLDQTPQTGRSVQGPTNPMPTKRSTGTASGAGGTRQAPGLERVRRQLREVDETVPSPPSSLDLDRRTASAARTGRAEMREAREEHNETSPVLTGGDVDADWEDAYSVGDEAPGGDNPTPDQDRVDDIGKALGVEYQDNEELKAADKITERDKHRWELDPASSEDYTDRD
jgi:Family of unknown function (DUF6335)